jgi:glycosyltransferase involved in cell wall biosynthesis
MLHLALARAKLSEKEGLQVVLQAAEKIKKKNVQIRIHLVGHLDEQASQLVANSPAADLFQTHGFISQTRCDFFRSMHVGLVPYLDYEDMSYIFPIKVLEHLSQANAVIASNVPGLASMIQHEYNGLLFEPGDSDDLARCILRLYDDFALWRKLSLNAMESVRKFDLVDKNRTIFEQISKGKNGGFR